MNSARRSESTISDRSNSSSTHDNAKRVRFDNVKNNEKPPAKTNSSSNLNKLVNNGASTLNNKNSLVRSNTFDTLSVNPFKQDRKTHSAVNNNRGEDLMAWNKLQNKKKEDAKKETTSIVFEDKRLHQIYMMVSLFKRF